MKLHLTKGDEDTYQIQHYDRQSIMINDQVYSHSLIVMPRYLTNWEIERFDELTFEHFKRLRALNPELVLLGTGSQLRFPATELLMPLMTEGIGVEVMDIYAACRTYMILMAEGRAVAAALLIEPFTD
jgi:uncharacterized protein